MSATVHTTPTVPLGASIARVRAGNAYLPDITVGVPAEAGWTTADVIFGSDPTILRTLMAAAQTAYQTGRADFAAMTVFNHYSWMLVSAALGAYLVDRILPDLTLPNIALHRDAAGRSDRLAFVHDTVRTVAGTPAAAHASASVVPEDDLSLAAVRLAIEAHFAPVIDAFRATAPLGKKALWLALADNCAWVLMNYGDAAAPPNGLAGLIAAFVQHPASPMRGGTTLLEIPYAGDRHRFIDRGSCCLSYKLPTGEKCSTCPLRPPPERVSLLRAYLAEMAASPST